MKTWPFSLYAGTLAASLAVSLSAVAYVNVNIDTEGLFNVPEDRQYDETARKILNTGAQWLVKEGDTRLLKRAIAKVSTADCYVNGSSHTMEFSMRNWPVPKQYGCRNLTNIAVPSGGRRYMITQMATLIKNSHFKTMFLALDAWAFRHDTKRKRQVTDEIYSEARRSLGLPKGPYEGDSVRKLGLTDVSEVINFSYFVRNMRQLVFDGGPTKRFAVSPVNKRFAVVPLNEVLITDEPTPLELVLSDGSRKRGRESYEKLLRWGRYSYSDNVLKPFVEEIIVADYKILLRALQDAGKRVVFLLTPYSPEVWECRQQNALACEGLPIIEARIRKLADEMGIDVVGSYDPKIAGVVSDDFLDGHHIREGAIARIGITERNG